MIKLSDCPLCKNKPEIGYAFGEYFVHCSDKCPSPGCFHAGDTITACSWNDWAEWIARYNQKQQDMPIIDEARAAKAMEDSQ